MCAQPRFFKKQVLAKLAFFSDLKKWGHPDKNNLISWKHVQNKGNVEHGTFLDSANNSSYHLNLFSHLRWV